MIIAILFFVCLAVTIHFSGKMLKFRDEDELIPQIPLNALNAIPILLCWNVYLLVLLMLK